MDCPENQCTKDVSDVSSVLLHEGKALLSATEKASAFNNHYHTALPTLDASSNQEMSLANRLSLDAIGHGKCVVNSHEVLFAVRKIKNSSAAGPDGLDGHQARNRTRDFPQRRRRRRGD